MTAPTPRRRRTGRGLKVLVAGALVAGITFALATSTDARPRHQVRQAGAVLAERQVSAPGVNGTAYVVKYWSNSARNRSVMVTGLVVVPPGTAPAGGWPVVSYAHSTDGMTRLCAPSSDPSDDVPGINSLLANGWEVVASDYQGEGNSSLGASANGLQPHGVNLPTAYNVIDMVHAADDLSVAHASTRYVVWGYSQGAAASTFATSTAASYAPDLSLEGVVSTAPPAGLADDFYGSGSDSASPFTLMYVAGYHNAYGNAVPLGGILTPTGKSLYNGLRHECYDTLAQNIGNYTVSQVFRTTTLSLRFALLLDANDPLFISRASNTPLLIVQGLADTTDTASETEMLDSHLCALGQDTVMWEYPGLDHNSILGPSQADLDHWIADRFAGHGNPDAYSPNGEGGIQRSACT